MCPIFLSSVRPPSGTIELLLESSLFDRVKAELRGDRELQLYFPHSFAMQFGEFWSQSAVKRNGSE